MENSINKLSKTYSTYAQLPDHLTLSYEGKVKFIKNCLKDLGYSKQLIAYLLSTYDLKSFITHYSNNHLALADHFIGHARRVDEAQRSY